MVLEDRISKELEQKKIIPETQVGFRKGRSTIDNIMILNYVANREIKEKGGKLYAFFADLTAAFDKVNRRELSKIMKEKGINRKLRTRIDKIYTETRNKVRVNGEISEKLDNERSKTGMPTKLDTIFIVHSRFGGKYEKRTSGRNSRRKRKVIVIGLRRRYNIIGENGEGDERNDG